MPSPTDITNLSNLATELNDLRTQVNKQGFVSPADAAILQELTNSEAEAGLQNWAAYIGLLNKLLEEGQEEYDVIRKSIRSMSLI